MDFEAFKHSDKRAYGNGVSPATPDTSPRSVPSVHSAPLLLCAFRERNKSSDSLEKSPGQVIVTACAGTESMSEVFLTDLLSAAGLHRALPA
jgi:hypothetical protein